MWKKRLHVIRWRKRRRRQRWDLKICAPFSFLKPIFVGFSFASVIQPSPRFPVLLSDFFYFSFLLFPLFIADLKTKIERERERERDKQRNKGFALSLKGDTFHRSANYAKENQKTVCPFPALKSCFLFRKEKIVSIHYGFSTHFQVYVCVCVCADVVVSARNYFLLFDLHTLCRSASRLCDN